MSNNHRWTLADFPDQRGCRWLITGATNGLGLATARAAADAGAELVLPVRNRALGDELNLSLGGGHTVIDMDLASLESVRSAAASIKGDIDVLVNNAGMMSRRREETRDGFERVLGVNFLGPFAFTNALIPRVRDRIVIVGSNVHHRATIDLADPHFRRRRWSIAASYSESKLADMAWGLGLERRLRGAGIGVQLVHPGWVMSNMQSAIGDPRLAKTITVATTPIAQSADKSALCTLFAATMDLPPCSYVGPDGRTHLHGWPSLIGRSSAASDPRVADAVWDIGVRETGVDLPGAYK